MPDFLTKAQDLFEQTRALRRDFHRHPELGFQEMRTSEIVARELRSLGFEVQTGVAGTGVVAHLRGRQPGPLVLLRFDMDALPVTEETGAEYASQNPGVMHACGHDGHVAIGLTVARILWDLRHQLGGAARLIFQPAEEGLGGAQGMIAAGVIENPRPDVALAMHLWNDKPVGWLGMASGPVMAASDEFHLRIIGRGGHGASPHQTVDPVLAAAHLITALQGIVSRNVSPLQTAVLSVTAVQAGSAFNVIPPMAEMKGTIRAFDPGIRDLVLRRFRQVVDGVAAAFLCTTELDLHAVTPAVINHMEITERVRGVASRILPGDEVDTEARTMGSEDMAFILDRVPGCYMFVGSANSAKGLDAAHHHPRFDFDEDVLPRAVALMAGLAVEFLREG